MKPRTRPASLLVPWFSAETVSTRSPVGVPILPRVRDVPADGAGSAPPSAAAPRMGWRFGLGVYAALAAGAVAITWPLLLHPGRLPYHHDPPIFTWVMASMARRLLSAPLTLFHAS